MTTTPAPHSALDQTRAARIERIAARRERRNAAVPGEALAPSPVTQPVTQPPTRTNDVDAALAARLDKLAAVRSGRSQVPPTGRTTAPTKKRRHPAKHSRAAALTLSVLASGGLGFLFASTDAGVSAAPAVPVGVVPASSATAAASSTPAVVATASHVVSATVPAPAATVPAATVPAATVPAATVPAVPITVNGQSFHNKFGDVQVQVTFGSDGAITAVDAVQVPFQDGKSVRINARAVPQLNSEALTAQNASVNTVSGATYTSVGYKQSLQSAIDIAVANGVPVSAAA